MKKNIIYCIQLVLSSILIGLIISAFIYVAGKTFVLLEEVASSKLRVFIPVCLITMAFTSGIVMINKRLVGHMGSGIKTLELYFDDDIDYNPFIKLPLLLINSLSAFFQGFVFGTEAPSIFISASITKIVSKLFGDEDKEMIKASASSGFAVAFLAPFAGFLHLIEEHKKELSIKLLIKTVFMIAISFSVAYFSFKRHPFSFIHIHKLPIKFIYIIIIVSILSTVFASIYRVMHKYVDKVSNMGNFMVIFTPLLGLGFMLISRFKPILAGSGEFVMEEYLLDYSLLFLFALLFIRLMLMFISESSYLSGGSVLPLLAIGAVISNIVIVLFDKMGINIYEHRDIIMMVGMCTTLGVGASIPFASLVLGIEFTKSIHILWPLILSILLSFVIKKIINIIYYRNKNIEAFRDNDTV